EEKAARDGKRTVKRKPPEKNFVNWDKNTFARLIAAPQERLTSRFQVTHGMLLNVLSRQGDGCRAMRDLIRHCHDSPKAKKAHVKRAWQLFRSLLDRKIVEFIPQTPSPLNGERASLPAKGSATAGLRGEINPEPAVPIAATTPNLTHLRSRQLPYLRVNVEL